eukprot:Blabericola_migrator_1__7019@NODE_355_length_9465_cov_113_241434_g284_i0_p2_GENE_NODE_355_length_9465_cov_113_241434_g284_i0NODE_355_length_9465_cov_113_241434_g284_i0_p2_ORF_typecomplete_len663_score144_36AAA_23/PF13476_6/0_055SMC_N/PF02463_19/0_099HOOK/PF05622_12/0_13Atg14/PF10186_9/0_49CorA/PF01544_18/2_1Exonuc_VII_L/PF02601_15/2_5Phage_HK97_TLTM/PF06120_11/0_23Phage_HK97_TLTM/PF06120_11/1_3e04Retrotrans_gag/PF03732_17/82Retrotrans_gag/PF03732_17/8_9PV1/PF06637_11/9_5Borrelia_P83/PF05262_11/1
MACKDDEACSQEESGLCGSLSSPFIIRSSLSLTEEEDDDVIHIEDTSFYSSDGIVDSKLASIIVTPPTRSRLASDLSTEGTKRRNKYSDEDDEEDEEDMLTEENFQPSRFVKPPQVPALRPKGGLPPPASDTPYWEKVKSPHQCGERKGGPRNRTLSNSGHNSTPAKIDVDFGDSVSSELMTPSTERLRASRKEEVIGFLRQVISSERALRSKVAELKDERDSVQENNFRFEHILRRCVGQQAKELESVKRSIEAKQKEVQEERDQRKQEELRRKRAEKSLAQYRQRLMGLKQIALSAQTYLAQAEALLAEETVQDEAAVLIKSPDDARAVAAAHIQRRRDLWRLRQQQCSHPTTLSPTATPQPLNEVQVDSAASPHESIARKALEDIEMILDILCRTFKIEAEMLMEGVPAAPCKPTRPWVPLSLEPQAPRQSASAARVYRLLRKIERDIATKSKEYRESASLPPPPKATSLPPRPKTPSYVRSCSQPTQGKADMTHSDTGTDMTHSDMTHTQSTATQTQHSSVTSPQTTIKTEPPPPPRQPPSWAPDSCTQLGPDRFSGPSPSHSPDRLAGPLWLKQPPRLYNGRLDLISNSLVIPPPSSVIYRRVQTTDVQHYAITASPSPLHYRGYSTPSSTPTSPLVFKQPPRLSNVRFGLRRQLAS